jgi:hypothetical protein
MNKTFIVCVLLMVILLYQCSDDIESFMTTKRSCNKIDGRCYKVSTKYDADTHENASELLAKLNIFSIKMLRHLRNTYLWGNVGSNYKKNMVEFLLYNYNPDRIVENVPKGSVNTSYVENKGEVFAICLREKLSGKNKFIPIHSLEFVVLHEMAHMASKTVGHYSEFWVNFKILLHEANKIGLHRPINYEKNPIVYCSLALEYNPFFDPSIPDKI